MSAAACEVAADRRADARTDHDVAAKSAAGRAAHGRAHERAAYASREAGNLVIARRLRLGCLGRRAGRQRDAQCGSYSQNFGLYHFLSPVK